MGSTPDLHAQSTTTVEEDKHSAGQRKVNLIWEFTQAFIALSVVSTVLIVAALIALVILKPDASEKAIGLAITAFLLLSNLASLIIGFYFGRTNHQKIGGVQLGR
jgi:glucan phosphoethanolaminetransferase (alkaline phosphatase superfamily)